MTSKLLEIDRIRVFSKPTLAVDSDGTFQIQRNLSFFVVQKYHFPVKTSVHFTFKLAALKAASMKNEAHLTFARHAGL